MGRLSGKTAVVTGAASAAGIGFGIARALAQEGAAVTITDVDEGGAARRAGQLTEAGFRSTGLRHDVADEASWISVIDQTLAIYESLDILVNNAGITLRHTVDEMPLEVWQKVIAVNLTGPFLGCKHGVAAMLRQGRGGSIINIASIAGLRGFQKSVAYGASKGGMRQISKVVAVEGASAGIRCNTIFPGMITSDIHKAIIEDSPEQHRAIVASIPLQRMGEPADIAQCAVYLASEEARFVTGAEIVVDGGSTAR